MRNIKDEIVGDFEFQSFAIKRESHKQNDLVLQSFESHIFEYFLKVHGVSDLERIKCHSENAQIKHYVSANKREFYYQNKLVLSVYIDKENLVVDLYY